MTAGPLNLNFRRPCRPPVMRDDIISNFKEIAGTSSIGRILRHAETLTIDDDLPSHFAAAASPHSRLQIGRSCLLVPRGIKIHCEFISRSISQHRRVMGVEFVITMQSNSPHYNEICPPIDNNSCYMHGNSEVMLPPMAANSVTPEDGYLHNTNDAPSYPLITQATFKANNSSATNKSINITTIAHNAKRKLSTHAILDDDMLSLDISDEEIDSFMDDAMQQDDDALDASSDNVDHKSHPSQGESSDIDARVQCQEAKLVTTMQKSAASRAAVQRLGILSTERLDFARQSLQGADLPSLASATHMLSRNGLPQIACNKKCEASYENIIAAARMVVDN